MHGTPHVSISKPFHPTITILKVPVKLAEVRGGRRMEDGVCRKKITEKTKFFEKISFRTNFFEKI